MSSPASDIQQLLLRLRNEYIAELPSRFNDLEQHVLMLESKDGFQLAFEEVCRITHSLKGSAGTHGLNMISTICHQMEDRLVAANHLTRRGQSDLVNACLGHIDLMRQVRQAAAEGRDDSRLFSAALAKYSLQHATKLSCLLVEASRANQVMLQDALSEVPIEFAITSHGLEALDRLLHRKYDLLITGLELQSLNGVALLAAVRLSGGMNARIATILFTSSRKLSLPDGVQPDVVLHKSVNFKSDLLKAIALLTPQKAF